MKTFFLCLIRPDFMQMLLISSLLFLLPLKRRPQWKRNAACLIPASVIMGSCSMMISMTLSQHGYGLKSISEIAARYGGLSRIQTDDDIFILSVLIPLPQQKMNP